jgi:hypothetical protein
MLQWSLLSLIIFGMNLFALISNFFSSWVSIVVFSTTFFWSLPFAGAAPPFYVTAGAIFLLSFLSSFFSSIKVFEFSFSGPDSS